MLTRGVPGLEFLLKFREKKSPGTKKEQFPPLKSVFHFL